MAVLAKKIVRMDGKSFEIIEGTAKLTKNGRIKKTPNNTKKNRDTCVNIKEEDIPKFMKYFDMKIMCAQDIYKRKIAVRNKVMFVCAINIGLRVSDFVKLKWETILLNNGNFRDGVKIKPDKTSRSKGGKGKLVFLSFNEIFKNAIKYYMTENEINLSDVNFNDYLFKTSKSRTGHIDTDTWSLIVTNAAKTIGITYSVSSHSCRKTFARSRYDHAADKNEALILLQELFGHESTEVTRAYICIRKEEFVGFYNSVNLGYL